MKYDSELKELISDIMGDDEEEKEADEKKKPASFNSVPLDGRRASDKAVQAEVRRRLQVYQTLYSVMAFVFLFLAIRLFQKGETIGGIVFLALCSVISFFGGIILSAMKKH